MPIAPLEIPQEVRSFLEAARVARMATVDDTGIPAVVPICYQIQGQSLFSVVDDKPKNVEPLRLQRVRNIHANPNMAVVVDHWDEDWSRLGWVLMRGMGEILQGPSESCRKAIDLLRDKYPHYRGMNLRNQPVIRMDLISVRHWGNLTPPAER